MADPAAGVISRSVLAMHSNTKSARNITPLVRTLTNEFRSRQTPTVHFHRDDEDWSDPDEMPPLASHSVPATTSRQTLLKRMQASVELDKNYASPNPSKDSIGLESGSQSMEGTAEAGNSSDTANTGESIDPTQGTVKSTAKKVVAMVHSVSPTTQMTNSHHC